MYSVISKDDDTLDLASESAALKEPRVLMFDLAKATDKTYSRYLKLTGSQFNEWHPTTDVTAALLQANMRSSLKFFKAGAQVDEQWDLYVQYYVEFQGIESGN